jgi:hypothetical protein
MTRMAKTNKEEALELFALLGVDPARLTQPLGKRTGSRIRMLHGSNSATASFAPKNTEERRREGRLAPDQTRLADAARLRPGFDVRVVDIAPRGVLIEAPTRLHIGTRVELALFTSETGTRLDMAGTVRRCHISKLSPLTYRGALEFHEPIELESLEPFLTPEVLSA